MKQRQAEAGYEGSCVSGRAAAVLAGLRKPGEAKIHEEKTKGMEAKLKQMLCSHSCLNLFWLAKIIR